MKIIKTITFHVFLHKQWVVKVDHLMPLQQQYPHLRKYLILKAFVVNDVLLAISKVFIKQLDIIIAGWDPKPCS